MMEEINKIADEMRNSLSEYCINECKAYCCRKGYLIVTEDELDLIAGIKKQGLIEEGFAKQLLGGNYSLILHYCPEGCPALKDFKCTIHKDDKRPATCKNFPIFIIGKEIRISSRCTAKKDNKFFKFKKDAEALGYEIIEEFISFK